MTQQADDDNRCWVCRKYGGPPDGVCPNCGGPPDPRFDKEPPDD